jgi:hypothetical protein
MNTSKMLILATLASLATAGAHAADAPKGACTLLTQPEIDSITGGKSGAGSAMDQEVPAKSGQPVTVYICMWPVPGIGGQVVISMAPMPPGQTAKSLSQDNAGMKALRDQHYTEEAKDFGQSSCSGMAPPASAKDGLSMTACTAAPNGKLISVTFMSPTKKLSLEQTNDLLNKAIARMH